VLGGKERTVGGRGGLVRGPLGLRIMVANEKDYGISSGKLGYPGFLSALIQKWSSS